MFTIRLERLDELSAISIELGILTYLQGLAQYDNEIGICESELDFAQRKVTSYLWDRQLQVVTTLRKLVTNEEFVEPL